MSDLGPKGSQLGRGYYIKVENNSFGFLTTIKEIFENVNDLLMSIVYLWFETEMIIFHMYMYVYMYVCI